MNDPPILTSSFGVHESKQAMHMSFLLVLNKNVPMHASKCTQASNINWAVLKWSALSCYSYTYVQLFNDYNSESNGLYHTVGLFPYVQIFPNGQSLALAKLFPI